MDERKGLLLVLMEPPAPLEDEFNDWYDTEHFPQRRALPGFETAFRWVCVSGWPRWAATYDMNSVAALETPEYKAVSGVNSTAWTRRMLPRTIGRTRLVLEQIEPGQMIGLPPAEIAALVLACYPGALDPKVCLDQAQALAGCLQPRVFRTAQGSPQTFVVAELSRTTGAETVRTALGAVSGVGALLLNIYAPYWRERG